MNAFSWPQAVSTRPQVTIIPAQPGWYTVQPVRDRDGKVTELLKNCIVGWIVDVGEPTSEGENPGCTVTPFTVTGTSREVDVICDPTGRIEMPYIEIFGCEHDAIAFFEIPRAATAAASAEPAE